MSGGGRAREGGTLEETGRFRSLPSARVIRRPATHSDSSQSMLKVPTPAPCYFRCGFPNAGLPGNFSPGTSDQSFLVAVDLV